MRARWSESILDECFRSILEQRPELKPESLHRTRELMKEASPTASSPDQAIVTFNLRDFPEDELVQYNIEAQHPDDFVLHAIDLAPGLVTQVVKDQAGGLKNPPKTVGELLDTLRDQGLVRSVAKLRELFGAAAPLV